MTPDNDTIEVPLSRGLVALIDAADAAAVLQYKWHAYGMPGQVTYAFHNFRDEHGRKRPLSLHRFLMTPPPGVPVDHINGNGLDCRRANMRIAHGSGNQRNVGKKSKAALYKGVSHEVARPGRPNPRKKPYLAKISVNYRTINLGRFATAEEAARAYDRAAREHFGEFARLNFPDAA